MPMPNGLELSRSAAQAGYHSRAGQTAGQPTRPFRPPAESASASCWASANRPLAGRAPKVPDVNTPSVIRLVRIRAMGLTSGGLEIHIVSAVVWLPPTLGLSAVVA